MSKRYGNYEEANADIGRVMDQIKELEGVHMVELQDTDHQERSGSKTSEIAWSEIMVSMAVKPSDNNE